MMLAHVGHWYAELLYVLPVVVVVAWLAVANRRERRREARPRDAPGAASDSSR